MLEIFAGIKCRVSAYFNDTGVCIILATLKNTDLTSIFGSGYIHTVLKLTSIYGS